MRIAVDARHLAAGRGVGRATRCTLEAMRAAAGDVDWRLHAPDRHGPAARAAYAAAALAGRPRIDRQAGGADVVWLPAPRPVAVGRGVPYVLTVHDLSWVQRPGDFTAYERLWHGAARLRRLARRAAAVIAVSEATARALRDHWDVEARVVRSGPGAAPQVPGGAEASAHPRPYFLWVGALEPRKAPDVLARAWARAHTNGLDADLLVVGEGRAPLAGPGVVRLGAVDDDRRLAALYAGALAVVQPSWLEGFGLTPVEAAAHGTPAIVADLPVYDETIGAGALRVAPGDDRALAGALARLAGEPELRARLAADGARAVAALSWERAGRETLAVLREVAR
jgi:glycosyltransferase involved in cell wall biosynthesis